MNLSKLAFAFGIVAFEKAYFGVQGYNTGEQTLASSECIPPIRINSGSEGVEVPLFVGTNVSEANSTNMEEQSMRVDRALPNSDSSGAVFKTWSQEQITYHGLCDLVLLQNPDFNNGLGMDIHIRTKQTEQQWTYTSNAVLRIGKETLEVMGSKESRSQYWISGMVGQEFGDEQVAQISGYPIHFRRLNNQQDEFTVDLGNNEMIVMKTWNDIVRVDIRGARAESFGNSRGAMGEFNKSGKYMALENTSQNALVQEWQVHSQLFYNFERSATPSCSSSSTETRQPLKKLVTQDEAEIACSHVGPEQEMCVLDVMASNDLGMASAY